MSTEKTEILMRWKTYSYNDTGIYVINGIMHNVKELYEKAMTRKDSEGGLWYSKVVRITPNNMTMSELVSMAEDHYTNMDMRPEDWENLGYERVEGSKAEALEGAITRTLDAIGPASGRKRNQLPPWMDETYDIDNKSMSGLDMFIQASVIVDSNGTSWHFTDVEFATFDPSPKYLTDHQTRKDALRNIPLNNKSPEDIKSYKGLVSSVDASRISQHQVRLASKLL
jgi:hypothetical protein